MLGTRRDAIARARPARRWGVVLGTLGRQGNPAILERIQAALDRAGKDHFLLLLSEVFPAKLRLFHEVEAWVQISCPRLSVDWGEAFHAPVLTPYEALVCLGEAEWREVYPMD